MAMSYGDWLAANPLPYDLQAFVDESNAKYADLQYADRPQEFFDQYEMMRRANAEAQAQYYIQNPDVYLDPMMTAFNPFITNSGMPWYVKGPGGTSTVEYIGEAPPPVDWDAEAAPGKPVIGPAVAPGMSVEDYNRYNPNAPTSVQAGSDQEKAVLSGGGMLSGNKPAGGGVSSANQGTGDTSGYNTYNSAVMQKAIQSVGGQEAWNRLSQPQRNAILAAFGAGPNGMLFGGNQNPQVLPGVNQNPQGDNPEPTFGNGQRPRPRMQWGGGAGMGTTTPGWNTANWNRRGLLG